SVVVPTNLPSWRMKLSATAGDSLLMLQQDALPNVGSGNHSPISISGGRTMKKIGDEQFLLLPASSQPYIAAGNYYIGVASEGVGPSGSTIGSGSSLFTLTSYGALAVSNIGTVDSSGITDILVTNNSEAGQCSAFQFVVPSGTLALEVSLENRVGNPVMSL